MVWLSDFYVHSEPNDKNGDNEDKKNAMQQPFPFQHLPSNVTPHKDMVSFTDLTCSSDDEDYLTKACLLVKHNKTIQKEL